MSRMLCATLFLASLAAPSSGAEPADLKLLKVTKIWDEGKHNAFTDLIRYQDRWFCTFREGDGHAAGPGTIRVITSNDGVKWQSAALVTQKDIDLRDPKLSITPDGRLMIVAAAAVPANRDPLTDHYSLVLFSKDGKSWTEPKQVMGSFQWLWRVTWHNDMAYGVAYTWEPKAPAGKDHRRSWLVRSKDAITWEKVADFKEKNPSEATIRFAGDTAYWLQRRDGEPNTAYFGSAQPPYTDWTWHDIGFYFGGPNFIQLPDQSWWACGRIRGKKTETVLCKLGVKAGKLTPAVTLPSGGDSSYAGMVWHTDKLWISYYSSHEGKTNIYLAELGR